MSEHPFLGREMSEPRDHSEHMQQLIDEEVARILREADEHAYRMLEDHRDDLERMTEALIEREVLTEQEITQLIGKRPGIVVEEPTNSRPHGDEVVASLDNPS
jgi:cell division protease FtsH